MQKNRPYDLQPYDSVWKQWYQDRANKIAPLFGDNLVSIEHVGSTSIEGMLAKPNIDILVVVKQLDDVTNRLPAFTAAGYTPQGREYVGGGDEYMTEDTPDGRRITSVHVLELGNPKIRAYREFREYLRHNETDRQRYIDLKKRLYSEYKENYGAYDSGKTELITAIKARAKEWATTHLPD